MAPFTPTLRQQIKEAIDAIATAKGRHHSSPEQQEAFLREACRNFYFEDHPVAFGVLFGHIEEKFQLNYQQLLEEVTRV
ncbi:MAG: hypothetical protein ACFFB3_07800 [Candidatus Hodarchaeota archaeon]